MPFEARMAALLEEARAVGVLPTELDEAHMQGLFERFSRNLDAAERYVPSEFAGRVTLFRAMNRPGGKRAGAKLAAAWRKVVGDGLTICDVPGDHYGMLQEPHVRTLAERLQACLDEATARVPAGAA